MTAKEKLRGIVEELSEADAVDVLDYMGTQRRGRDGLAASPETVPEPVQTTAKPRPRHRRLATMTTIPAWLFVGLFLSVYLAMAVVIVVAMVRG